MRYLLLALLAVGLYAAEVHSAEMRRQGGREDGGHEKGGHEKMDMPPANPDAERNPQLAVGHGQVALAWGSNTAIWFASSADGGATFGPKVKVADIGALALGHHRGPRVTILADAILVTATVGLRVSPDPKEYGRPEAGELTVWRSTDNGRTWLKTGLINDTPAAASEGLHSIAADAQGNLFAAWLDKRTKTGTQLYGARSADGGRTWSKNVLIYASPDGTICQCCDPSVAFDDKGRVHIMWRNVLGGYRDFYLTESADFVHFSAARKLGEGTWKIDGCPMDGGGIAFDHARLVTAWRRESRIYLDEPGAPEIPVGDGKDVAIAGGARGIYLIWSSLNGVQFLPPGAKTPLKIADEGTFPGVAELADGSALVAWEAGGVIRTRRLP